MNSAVMAREDLLQRVTAEAGRRGVPAEDLMNQIVETGLAHLPAAAASESGAAHTGADLLARWEREGALLPAEAAPDAPALARQIREQNQRRFL